MPPPSAHCLVARNGAIDDRQVRIAVEDAAAIAVGTLARAIVVCGIVDDSAAHNAQIATIVVDSPTKASFVYLDSAVKDAQTAGEVVVNAAPVASLLTDFG